MIMKLPELQSPERYAGLYVFDFGDQVAVGYTADEIAVLLESEKYAQGKVYRIHRAAPDGTMELQGVPPETFKIEDGIFFYRTDPDKAAADFDTLCRIAKKTPPPCRMKAQRAKLETEGPQHATAVIFPAEFTHDVAAWLEKVGFEGGDTVEGGPSTVTTYYDAGPTVEKREQFWPADSISRPADEVLATTHLAVQRVVA